MGIPCLLMLREKRLALRVLRCLTGALQTGLLAFLDARIACEQSGLFEGGAEVGICLNKGAGDSVAYRACLAGHSTAEHLDCDVEVAAVLSQLQRVLDHLPVECAATEVVPCFLAVYNNLPGARVKPDTSNRALPAARAVVVSRSFCASGVVHISP